ncbi:hypothetical protein [Flavihumibacter profundi]|uniref:hypothetical protein n=1 Tax=Flavihumibacter profundi TaxID=2716883 RepID=UPI001CC5D9F7|nr:hypothetical protein [Flavihumibacter profundi]MBZ5857294.1 hypothetical protein [Flavihumibacter profundi]
MIEQTDLVVNEWIYIPPVNIPDSGGNITSQVTLEVMKKTAPTKKGIACRFTCRFVNESDAILLYVAEDSYVIDLADKVDRNEILRMIRNSYSKYTDKFEFRKLGTILENRKLPVLEEHNIDVDAIVPLLYF